MNGDGKKEPNVGLISAFLIFFLLIYGGALYFYSSYISYVRHGTATAACSNAKTCAICVTTLLKENDIGQQGKYTLKGEFSGNDAIFYGGELFAEDTAFKNEYRDAGMEYWAVTVNDGKAQEAWYSSHPLSDDELHEYTFGEIQALMPVYMPFLRPVTFLKNGVIDKSKLIGYRKIS